MQTVIVNKKAPELRVSHPARYAFFPNALKRRLSDKVEIAVELRFPNVT